MKEKFIRYCVTFFLPLLCLWVMRLPPSLRLLLPVLGSYVVVFLLLFIVSRWHYKKGELLFLFLPLCYLILFCFPPDLALKFWELWKNQTFNRFYFVFWSDYYNACMIFGAYLAKLLWEIGRQVVAMVKKPSSATTALPEDSKA